MKVVSIADPKATEKHYTPIEIAKLWRFGVDTIRDIFRNEPGVIMVGNNVSRPGRKRAYVSMRIPESVVIRVHTRLSLAA